MAHRQAYRPQRPFSTVEGVGSESWKRLDMGAIGLLLEFYDKFNGYNRYSLTVTYGEVKHKMSSLIFTRWVWQLIGFGFLEVKRWGRLQRKCTIYGLSDRWRKLSERPEKLNEIASLLSQIDRLKRQPGSSEKRSQINALRYQICSM
jgi:hypothetical protein